MMQKVTDRIYYLPFDEHGDRPCLGYIRGDDYTLMVDAGNAVEHVKLYNDSLANLGFAKPDYVALTHWHWDHTYGLHAVACPSIACTQTNLYLADMMRWDWSDEAMAERLRTGEDNEFCDREIRVAYPDRSLITIRQADIAFTDVLTLRLGGITCELRQIENPHTADGVMIYIPEEKVIFLGDADCEGHHHGREPLYKEKLASLLKAMQHVDFHTCIPGHEDAMSREALFAFWQEELAR